MIIRNIGLPNWKSVSFYGLACFIFSASFFPAPAGAQRPRDVFERCQKALTDNITDDAGGQAFVQFEARDNYGVSDFQFGLRGKLKYRVGDRGRWQNARFECVINSRNGRVERAEYNPRASGYGRPVTNYPRVKVDTDGRGTFSGGFANSQVRRGWVDTRGDAQVGLSGQNFRIMFYGVVESFDGDREFTIRILRSDQGEARGKARVRLNRDRNEVELIDVRGRTRGDDFTGTFSRND
ncbi:MAG TPA: hypothetical protein VK525_12560 [Candidatus Saccharimonadales bacterium]|nr:hypothetical protein [Candidatus Saccharimonadales bacterium]